MIRCAFYSCPLGIMEIICDDDAVLSIKLVPSPGEHCPSAASDLAAAQLLEYLAGMRKVFDFPFRFRGSAFQNAVWNALLKIPYGQTRTYGEIAAFIGNPKAARAVGMACNRNPLWIAVPCHRVVGSNRSLTGYAGGLDLKRTLLELEQHNP